MKEFIKHNFVILLAFILPIGLIVIVALTSYFPSLLLSTDYNFVYSACIEGADYYPYRCDNYLQKLYSVVNGKLIVNPIDPVQDSDRNGVSDVDENYTARIFFHDTQKNESREITLTEAQTLTFSGLLTSPDGVTVSNKYGQEASFFPFFDGGSSYGYYLTKGKNRSKLDLINSNDRYYYQDNFKFIGWVL